MPDHCETCTGSGQTCAACGSDDACECEDADRTESECPECHGTGQNEDDDEGEEE